MIQVEKNITIPSDHRAGRPLRFPFPTMEVGDSFTVETPRTTVYNAAVSWAKRHNKKAKFTTQTIKGKTRIWRTK